MTMADHFTFDLVSPEKTLFSEPVSSAVIPGSTGYMTVYANHALAISTLSPGIIIVETQDGSKKDVFVKGGFVDITQTSVTLLAEDAKSSDELSGDELDTVIAQLEKEIEIVSDEDLKIRITDHIAQIQQVKLQIAG